jgi:tetratricopeptide (TPR) repeat protein
LKENAGPVVKTFLINKFTFIDFLAVTISLILIHICIAHSIFQIKDVEAISSQTKNSSFVYEMIEGGNLSLNKSKYEDAVKSFDQALKIDPRSVEALNGKGLAFNKLGRYEDAITWFDNALKMDPTSAQVLNNKGISLANLDRFEEAITWFDKAIKIDPNFVDALYNKGGALAELGKYDEAAMWTNKALEIDKTRQNASNSKSLLLPND